MNENIHIKKHEPFTSLPKAIRFISFQNEDGTNIRIDSYHKDILLLMGEMEDFYKSLSQIARDLNIGITTVKKKINELLLPTVEMGVPLVHKSTFIDNQNQKRCQYELFFHQSKLGMLYERFFDKDNGSSERNRWLNQWDISEKGGGSPDDQGGGSPDDQGVGRQTATNKTKENKTNINIEDTYVSSSQTDKSVRKKPSLKYNRDRKEFENMSEEFLDSLKKIAPSVNINTELERIKDWLLTHPNGKRKKAFERFIKQWIKKAEDTIQYNKIIINKKRGNLEWELSQKKKLNQSNTEHLEAGTKMQTLEELKCLELTTNNY